ncbi:hypothetical protein [Actinophytocola sp.]|uniref:hypothetical protein n=1 Tax=Actinophytocola sp. TaxID=1872138 RepID=UPI003D6AA080
MRPENGAGDPANEADVLEQQRDLTEDTEDTEPDEVPSTDVEANPADLREQSLPVPSEEEDWPDA